MTSSPDSAIEPLAVIGMAGRFPRARGVEEFWHNVRNGIECVSFFDDEELLRAGIPAVAVSHPRYIKAKARLEDVDLFDAAFFGYAPREAEAMDPQQRVFLECAHAALEDAGYAGPSHGGAIGVYAGASLNTYLLNHLGTHPELLQFVGFDKDYLATRVSYKLDLRGPSIVVQTACSTSLVAVCQAAQALLTYQCDIALAGGISISLPDKAGYFYTEGAIFSPDGHCRSFDAAAEGIVPGNGVGIVVLKRLQDALADGDVVHAVIRGFAVNNDGAGKVGYTAPGVEGQAQAILMAQALAGVSADTIGYVEAHGTATALGDPVEIAALTQAFRESTERNGFCAIGSVKTNIGHLDAAAGIAGLIKTVLALRDRVLPPSLHFERPNPKIDFESSPFFVNTALTEWRSEGPRRAGVSSFGIGGTNAHVVLEEPPVRVPSGTSRAWQVLTLSARTAEALDAVAADLARHLDVNTAANLADVAFTLQTGRRRMPHRRAFLCRDVHGAIAALETHDDRFTRARLGQDGAAPVAFMFPGDISQGLRMASQLYAGEPVFRAAIDECLAVADEGTRRAVVEGLCLAGEPARWEAGVAHVANADAHAALFAVEFALAKLWSAWGVTPAAVLGHGVGEYVAGCVSGLLPLAEAVRLSSGGMRAHWIPGAGAAPAAARSGQRGRAIPCISSATGTSVHEQDVRDPACRVRGMSRPARFAEGLSELQKLGIRIVLEVGPGQMLTALAGQFAPAGDRAFATVASLPDPDSAVRTLVEAVGELWLEGVSIDWSGYYASERRNRVQLPTYPFERQRFWLEPRTAAPVPIAAQGRGERTAWSDPPSSQAASGDKRRAAADTPLETSEPPIAVTLCSPGAEPKEIVTMPAPSSRTRAARSDVAIVGMAGRFPGAPDIETYWQNLRSGVESRTVFSDEEILAQGIPATALRNAKFVRSGFIMDGIDLFDAAFFGINPREAELLDPQHRVFLECAWEALENAGYDAETFPGSIGVFGGATLSSYLTANVLRNPDVVQSVGGRQAVFGSVPDYMVTRVAYKLNLKGPAYFVQSACSTSLVAVHLACQSLANHECEMVLAGGVSITVPHRIGYMYEDGGMLSPDGICRTFDANARGTVFGSGVGIVVLKRLADALADGDTIHAVINGVAANNDGSLKVGFTAPGVVGQSRVVAEALGAAGVPADTISYVEAHGTGTELGDPIEIAALTRAYRATTERRQFCAIGSVKPNIGHLDAAAGVSSLIKTVLALKNRQIPPTINFEKANSKIEFESSPFYVNTELRRWDANGTPRRAGVSSFGFGGTNAHVIVEEAPEASPAGPSRAAQLLVVTARTEQALEQATNRLADSLQRHPQPISDVAYTLAVGRRQFGHRRAVVCVDGEDAVEMLHGRDPRRILTAFAAAKDRPVVFMFPGQGSQYVDMGRELYRDEPLFRQIVDECAEGLRPHLGGLDLRQVLYPAAEDASASERLRQTSLTQSALFTVEYALARLWMSWGLTPEAMIGHSIGELVAACLAGVFSIEDALGLVALRGTLMEAMPRGAMAAVPLGADEVVRGLGSRLWLAAANAPSLCVVSGEPDALDTFIEARGREGIECRRLHTSHAFHSALMDGAVTAFTDAVRRTERHAPAIPFVSNVTGTWITDADAIDPEYWGSHIRQPVQFSEGVTQLLADSERLLLEVGPGNTLSALVRQHKNAGGHLAVASLRHPQERTSDLTTMLTALGRLWVSGAAVDWAGFYAGQQRRRVPLPSYPFERQRFWVEADKFSAKKTLLGVGMLQRKDFSEWFHVPSWKLAASHTASLGESNTPCLVFEDEGCSARISARLAANGRPVLRVRPGDRFERAADDSWTIAAGSRADYAALLSSLREAGRLPGTIVHAWGLTGTADATPDDDAVARAQDRGFYSLLYLAQALGQIGGNAPVQLGVITDGVHEVIGGEAIAPEKATVLGPCRVIPQELPTVSCRHIDLSTSESARLTDQQLDAVLGDVVSGRSGSLIAYRHGKRWTQTCDTARLEPLGGAAHPRLRPGGTYLITGGFGGIGQVIAEHLAETFKARLVLTGRRGLPAREQWPAALAGADAATRRRIEAVQKLEQLGAEVFVGEADVTDEVRMRALVTDARARFGGIDGVIHSAGIAGGGVIQLKKKEVAAAVLAPKVIGARILSRLFADQPLDFMLLCSSLTALVGGVGQVDYCAANSYLDAFARQFHAQTGTFTVAVNWNAWREVGMAVDTNVPEDLKESLKGAMLSSGISNAQGLDAFRRILGRCADRQVVISPNDLGLLSTATALVEDQEFTAAEPPAGDERPASTPAAASSSYHTRPSLQTPYVAARNETEQRICSVWQDLLGIDRVGVNDNFFELGGHSLLAIRVMARVNEALKSDIPVARLYDGLTVGFLASIVGTNGHTAHEPAEPAEDDGGSADKRRERARRQREQQARRRGAVREIAST